MALAACAGSAGQPPSSSEVAEAVRAVVQSNYAKFAGTAAGAPTVARVHDLGCSLAPDGRGYLCETTIETDTPAHGPRRATRLVRMVRSSSGWLAVME